MAIQHRGQYRILGAGSWTALFGLQSGLSYAWDTSPLPAGTYELQVQGHDTVSGNDSAWSATRSFQVQHAVVNTAPPAPAITAPVNGQSITDLIQVTWAPVSDPEGDTVLYRLERRLAGGNWISLMPHSTQLSYDWITSALPAGTYELRLFASDGQLESAASAIIQFTVSHPPPPVSTAPFLVLGGLTVLVDATSAGEEEPVLPGSVEPAFDGRLLGSSWGTRRRRWHLQTAPLTTTEFDAVMAAAPPESIVTASGVMFAGAAVSLMATVQAVEYIQAVEEPGGFLRQLTLALEEV